ncbi:MAG: FAD-dependent oxidoreductase [Nitrososphaerales archaeon]
MTPYDVIIIGGSAAGLTAALYSSRLGLRSLVITKDIGGQMLLTNEIQNYPGFVMISGFELANKIKEQAELYGAEFIYDEVIALEESKECPSLCFKVKTRFDEYHAITLILAFGKTPRDLGVKGEDTFKGKGISYCTICDGPLFKGRIVAIIGSGDQALESAQYLTNVASKVYLIHNYDKPIGSEELVKQVLSLKNVESLPNSKVIEFQGSSKLEKVLIQNTKSKEIKAIDIDGAFIEIGYVSKTDFVKDLVKVNDRKEIEIDKECKTSYSGIFAAGDVTDFPYKQAVISASQGCIAALSAYNYIQRLKGKASLKADWKAIKQKA